MNLAAVFLIAGVFLAYGVVSRRLNNTSATGPMLFTLAGLILALCWPGLLGNDTQHGSGHEIIHGVVHTLAEVTLVFVLFSDAAGIDLPLLKRDHNLPQRMLLIGMPLTIVLGAIVALMMFGMLSFWEAALLAAILAPTDAALGQAVVQSSSVPVRIRQSLNVESGLNDGIALPMILIMIGFASVTNEGVNLADSLQLGLLQVTMGPIAGAVIGYAGARMVDFATAKNWMSESFEGIGALSLALLAFAGAELVHGNGFIAAFVAGLTFGNCLRHPCKFLYEFAETEGQFFTLTTFLVFGFVAPSFIGHGFELAYVIYALLSLTLIRMIPIGISLLGSGVSKTTMAFTGWFGPRGLASILFALLIVENANITHSSEIISIVIITVLLSVFLHGVTAAPFARKYGQITSAMHECEESKPVTEMNYQNRLNR